MNALRRFASTAVLATAAFASIATSQVRQLAWVLNDSVLVPETAIPAGPGASVATITAEARGPRAAYTDGDLEVVLAVRGFTEATEPAFATIVLRSELDPTLAVQQTIELAPQESTQMVTLPLVIWAACEAGPCIEDYRLEVQNPTLGTTVFVAGEIKISQNGIAETPPEGAEAIVTLTPFGAAN